MRSVRFLAFVFGIAGLLGSSARGDLISADWKDPGDGLLTHDNVSGYDLLDVNVPANTSYNNIESQLGPGRKYAGFRHATRAELEALQVSAGIPDIGEYTQANLVPVQNLMSLVGI